MKNNYDDIILKYLSDLLDENGKKSFEAELEKDPALKSRLEAVSQNLKDIKGLMPADSDTDYFANVVPKVREKIESGSDRFKIGALQKVLASGFAVIILIVIILQFGGESNDYESFSSTLETADSEEVGEFVELRYSDIELYDIVSEIDLESYSDAINEQLDNNEDLYDYTDYAYFGLDGIDGISENEEAEIYSSLIDKKIL